MPKRLVFFRGSKPFPFNRNAVKQFGPGDIFQIVKDTGKVNHIVPVNRAKISKSQRFEQIALFEDGGLNGIFQLLNQRSGPGTDAIQFPQ